MTLGKRNSKESTAGEKGSRLGESFISHGTVLVVIDEGLLLASSG